MIMASAADTEKMTMMPWTDRAPQGLAEALSVPLVALGFFRSKKKVHWQL